MIQILYVLVMTHITIMAVTLFLHRSQAHRAVQFHPVIAHFFRLHLWLTTGMVTRQWVAIHRRHHQRSDVQDDPHSPHIHGIWRVLFAGAGLYHKASKDREMVERLSVGCPDDWIERNIYSAHSRVGIVLMLIINLLLFGAWGGLIWAIQMIWIPFWAAGVINGLAHWWGYKNPNAKDSSTNLIPWGIWIGGEELHANHHADGTSAKFSKKWWEFDIGWMYICMLRWCRLATVR